MLHNCIVFFILKPFTLYYLLRLKMNMSQKPKIDLVFENTTNTYTIFSITRSIEYNVSRIYRYILEPI